MAITAAPFALKNLGLDAEPLRQAVGSLVPNGGGVVQPGDLTVTQTGTPSLGVSVGIGRAWMPADTTANLSGQSYSTRGQYFAINDAPFTVNLATADPTNPRIDLIYIGAVDTQYGGASNVIKIDKVTGTPAATPTVPTLPPNAIALSQVAVAANATTILNANITNVVTGTVSPAKGLVGYASVTSNSGAIGALTIVCNIPTFTFKAWRSYRIQLTGNWYCSGTNSTGQFSIFTTPTTETAASTNNLTSIKSSSIHPDIAGEGRPVNLIRNRLVFSTDTTLQIKYGIARVYSTDGLYSQADPTNPVELAIYDDGAAI